MSHCHVYLSYHLVIHTYKHQLTKLIRLHMDNIYVTTKLLLKTNTMFKIIKTPGSSEFFPIFKVTTCNCPDGTMTHVHFSSYDRQKCVDYISNFKR